MMVRFEEDEYIAVAIFDAGNRVQTMEAMDEIFSYLDEDMKLLIFTTIQKLYYLSDEGYEELQKTVEIYIHYRTLYEPYQLHQDVLKQMF